MAPEEQLSPTPTSEAPAETPALKPPVDPATLVHTRLREGPFWRKIPAYAEVSEAEFLDHKWQAKHSITNIPKLLATLRGLVSDDFIKDAERGFAGAPMSVRVPTRIPCGCSSSRCSRASGPIIPSSTSTRCTSASTCRCRG
jgi:hypothetical protein